MTVGDVVVLTGLAVMVWAILRARRRNHKNGCDCGSCTGCTGCDHRAE